MTRRSNQAESHPHDELPEPFSRGMAEILAEPVPLLDLARIQSRIQAQTERNSVPHLWPRRIRQLACAVAVAAVVVVVASRWTHPTSAWAQAIQQVREASTLTYTQLLTIKGQEQPVKTRTFIAADGRKRTEQSGIGKSDRITTIFGADGYIRLTLLEATKSAIVEDTSKFPQFKNPGGGFLAWLEALKKAGGKPDKELGRKSLDGRAVTGFVATLANFTFTMWVDDETGKPARIEYEPQIKGVGYEATAMTDFRFDEPLDESLFSADVPEGYKVVGQPREAVAPSVPGGEESVVEALRGYTKQADGKFPASIADWGPWAVLFSKGSKDGKLDPEAVKVLSHLGAITPFLSGMKKSDYEYLGDGKTTAQKDDVVFWYKRPDGTYRAIYGDFSAKDIAADKLPKP
jgi:outer membrane lipoprotein-sorting protein